MTSVHVITLFWNSFPTTYHFFPMPPEVKPDTGRIWLTYRAFQTRQDRKLRRANSTQRFLHFHVSLAPLEDMVLTSGVPVYTHKDIWEVFKAIEYDHLTRKFVKYAQAETTKPTPRVAEDVVDADTPT